MAALLEPGGRFASFGGQICLADTELEEAVRTARSEFLADDDVPSPDGTPPDASMQWPGTVFDRILAALPERVTLMADVTLHPARRA